MCGMNNDLISRVALIKAIKTECNPYGKPTIDFESGKKVLKIIDNAPTVPQITVCCENADEKTLEELKAELKRVINEIRPQCENCDALNEYNSLAKSLNTASELLRKKRPQGKWHHSGECSVCHKRSYKTTPSGEIIGLDFTDFCKNCGAQMRGKQE